MTHLKIKGRSVVTFEGDTSDTADINAGFYYVNWYNQQLILYALLHTMFGNIVWLMYL
jgi:hypothetical protein